MRKLAMCAAAAVALFTASTANAASMLFQFDPTSSITISNNNTLCLGSCAMTAKLTLPTGSFSVDEGSSYTFDFATFKLGSGLGIGSFDVDTVLSFLEPTATGPATPSGSGDYAHAGIGRFSVTSGALTWDAPETFTTSDGSEFTLSLANLDGFKAGNTVKDALTITVDRIGGVVPTGGVPEPASWALMISGLALIGGTVRSQRRVAAVSAS
jgi:hypothetical protein